MQATTRRRTGRNRALDGLRGFALLGMLAWHAEVGWVQGGFARMTIFFVLSGYLATRSRVRRTDDGFVDFWVRRTLRLLPMTLVGVALAIGVTLLVGSPETRASLGADVTSVLTYTSNFHFIDDGQSYGELFERQSAFQHYWSLSIEEQLFLALPVLLVAAAAVARWLRLATWTVLVGGAVAVTAVSVAVGPSADALYFGTHTRLIEFLAGAALALTRSQWLDVTNAGPVGRLGRISAVVIVATLLLVDREADWLYAGGMHLFVLPVVAVIAAIETHDAVLDRVLDLRPLVALGRAALSIYVLHWPLFVLLDAWVPTSVPGPALAALKMVCGIAVGIAAYVVIEAPLLDETRRALRSGMPVLSRRLLPMVGVAVVLVVVGVSADATSPNQAYGFERAAQAFTQRRVEAPSSTQPATPTVGVFGGSTALMNGLGLADWASGTSEVDVRPGQARLGCGLLEEGERVVGLDSRDEPAFVAVDEACGGWADAWEQAAPGLDAAVVFLGVWEIADWRLPGSEQVLTVEDDAMATLLRDRLVEGLDRLRAGGVDHVVLMTSPVVGGGVDDDQARVRGLPADHARRTVAFNAILRDVSAAPDVSIFDYAGVIEGLPPAELARIVPDGVHPTWDSARELWSGPAGQHLVDHLVDHPGDARSSVDG